MTRGPRPSQPHGTEAGARRHQRRGESPCPACLRAARMARAERHGSDRILGEDTREIRNGLPGFVPYRWRGKAVTSA